MIKTLLLFDIDGTLIGNSNAGEKAYVKAIETCFNINVNIKGYSTSGKTDILNLMELLKINNINIEKIDRDKLIEAYLYHLKETVSLDPGKILPGVEQLLNTLIKINDIFLALGTGNLEKAARIKLKIHNLNKYFKIGGFGSDATKREDILAIAHRKAENYFKVSFHRVIAVGDTLLDIDSAKANGYHCISVATGPCSLDSFLKNGITSVLPNLAKTEVFIKLINSLPPTKYNV